MFCAFSCSGNSKTNKAGKTQAAKSEKQSTSIVLDKGSSSPIDSSFESRKEELPIHGVPEQDKLDSVKNSYPKKR